MKLIRTKKILQYRNSNNDKQFQDETTKVQSDKQ